MQGTVKASWAIAAIACLALAGCANGGTKEDPPPAPEARLEDRLEARLSPTVTLRDARVAYPSITEDPDTGKLLVAYFLVDHLPASTTTGTTTSKATGTTSTGSGMGHQMGGADVYVAQSMDKGATWTPPVKVNDKKVAKFDHGGVPRAVAFENDVYVVWGVKNATNQKYGHGYRAIEPHFARSTDGGKSFSAPVILDQTGPPAGPLEKAKDNRAFVSIEVDGSGTVYVGWIRQYGYVDPQDDGPAHAQVITSDDGGVTWNEVKSVQSPACECCQANLVRLGTDSVVFGWRDLDDDKAERQVRDMVVARTDDNGKTWTPTVEIYDAGFQVNGCSHSGPGLALDSKGRLHASFWVGNSSNAWGFHYTRSDDQGATWPARVIDTLQKEAPAGRTDVAVDAADRAWVVWEDRTTTPFTVRGALIGPDGALQDSFDLGSGQFPEVAPAGDGVAFVWEAGTALKMATASAATAGV